MTLVKNTIETHCGGVSKQTSKLMQKNALKESVNMIPSIYEGLKRRPPLSHIAKLTEPLSCYPYIHTVTNDDEEYSVILDGSSIRVFDMQGNEKTVAQYALTSLDYVTTQNPIEDLYVTTINNYTFILNKTVTVQMDDTVKSTSYATDALVFVAKGDYDTTYTVTITDSSGNTFTATYNSASSTGDDTVYPVQIATAIATNITDVLANSTDTWGVTREGATIYVVNISGNSFTIKAEDDNTNDDLFAFYKETGDYTNLPVIAPNGFIIKIAGDSSTNADDYFVEFHTTGDETFGEGYWQECADPEIPYMLDSSTMPHILYRDKDNENTFIYSLATWGERLAGDEDTAPNPSFVGNTIEEISTHKGRLAFLSNGNWLASDTGDIWQFFKASAREELDSDPIDITSNVGMTNLKHSLPFNGSMLVFSNTSCFTITGGNTFSNSTIGCDLTMEYECSSYCKPVRAAKGGFFIYENGQYSRVREIYIDNTYNTNARDITEHIPDYLPKNIFKIVSSTVNNTAVFMSTEEPENLYVYNWLFNTDDTKAQSAWGKWTFDNAKILGGHFKQNLLYLFIEYSDGCYLNVIDFTPKLKEDTTDFLIHLDRKIYYSGLESEDDYTTITLPYIADSDITVCDTAGYPLSYEINGVTVIIKGSYTDVIVGNSYTSYFIFPTLYYRIQTYNTSKVQDGLLMIKDVDVYFDDTGYFDVTVTPNVSTTSASVYTFISNILGTELSTLDKLNVSSGHYLFPVRYKNTDVEIKISNDSPLPSTFISTDWIGEFHARGT